MKEGVASSIHWKSYLYFYSWSSLNFSMHISLEGYYWYIENGRIKLHICWKKNLLEKGYKRHKYHQEIREFQFTSGYQFYCKIQVKQARCSIMKWSSVPFFKYKQIHKLIYKYERFVHFKDNTMTRGFTNYFLLTSLTSEWKLNLWNL